MSTRKTVKRAPRARVETVSQRFSVSFDYPVHFVHGVFEPSQPLLAKTIHRKGGLKPHRVLVYVDDGLARAWPDLVARIEAYFKAYGEIAVLADAPVRVGGGEQAKVGWETVREVMSVMGRNRMCRQSAIIAVGGGSVLDMVGFAVSLVHRGLRLIRVPTTVLSQNDGGVGVKTGMNEHGAKNFVGTFAPPFAVINDGTFLRTLPQEHWAGGIAEAFKVAMIRDRPFFDFLCRNAVRIRGRDQGLMEKLVARCARLHLRQIAGGGDPFEMGSARPLDFGHWLAHELEVLSGFEVGHGQAVAVGIAADSCYAMRKGYISPKDLDRVLRGLVASGLPVWTDWLDRRDDEGVRKVLSGLERFREHLGGVLTVTLPKPIGVGHEVHDMDAGLINEGLDSLRKYARSHGA